jgi:hypothetical protein
MVDLNPFRVRLTRATRAACTPLQWHASTSLATEGPRHKRKTTELVRVPVEGDDAADVEQSDPLEAADEDGGRRRGAVVVVGVTSGHGVRACVRVCVCVSVARGVGGRGVCERSRGREWKWGEGGEGTTERERAPPPPRQTTTTGVSPLGPPSSRPASSACPWRDERPSVRAAPARQAYSLPPRPPSPCAIGPHTTAPPESRGRRRPSDRAGLAEHADDSLVAVLAGGVQGRRPVGGVPRPHIRAPVEQQADDGRVAVEAGDV